MRNRLCVPVFAWKLGLISSSIQVLLGEVWKTNPQTSQPTRFLRHFKYLSAIKLITKYCIWVFCMQFSVAMETVNPKIWFLSRFQRVNIQQECFISNRTYFNYLCTIYKRFQEKDVISFRKKIVRERFSSFRFRQYFLTLKNWLLIFRDCFRPENKIKELFSW